MQDSSPTIRRLLGFVFFCLRLIPTGLAVCIGRCLGWLLHRVVRFRRQVVRDQMALALADRSEAERREIERGFYRHLGLLLVEMLRLPGAPRQAFLDATILHDGQRIPELLERGKGGVLLSGHMGNWELSGLATVNLGLPVCGIGKKMKNPVAETMRQMMRDEHGLEYIAVRNSMKTILRALRDNKGVAFLMDQNVVREEGMFVDFFGVPACTMVGIATLVERTDAVILPIACWRDPDLRHHHIELWEPLELEFPHADKEDNLRHNARRFNAVLEDMVRRHPEQWLWIHKRWKTRPEGEAEPPIRYR